jgi:hypothetical protein
MDLNSNMSNFFSISILDLKTSEPEQEPTGFTGLMVNWFKPANKPNRSVYDRPVWSLKPKT